MIYILLGLGIEGFTFYQLVLNFGLGNVFGLIFFSSMLGLWLFQHWVRRISLPTSQDANIQLPRKIIKGFLRILGAFLLMLPFPVLKVVGVLMLLPLVDLIFLIILGAWLQTWLRKSSQAFFKYGNLGKGGFAFYSSTRGPGFGATHGAGYENQNAESDLRDVTPGTLAPGSRTDDFPH